MAGDQQIARLRQTLRTLVRRLGILERGEALCCGVTLAQCHVLIELGGAEKLSVNDLAETLRLDKSTVSRSVENLVSCGLVRRETDPGDRRYVSLGLSEQGVRVFGELEERMDIYFGEIIDQLPAEKREQVLESLALLAEAVTTPDCCNVNLEGAGCSPQER